MWHVNAQNNFYVVRCKISNKATNLPVTDAKIHEERINKEFITSSRGEVVFAVPQYQTIALKIDHNDYYPHFFKIKIISDTVLNFTLKPIINSILIDEVVSVSSCPKRGDFVGNGVDYLDNKMIAQMPVIGGEKDVVKTLFSFPGYVNSSEGTCELSVRGGTNGENLFLLDGYTLYHPSHFLGIVSSYNSDVVSGVNAYKSAFPSRYGERASSVIDVTTRSPDMIKAKLSSEVGIISSKARLEFPIIKNKISLLVATRGSYLDKLAMLFQPKDDRETTNFKDLYGKLNIQISKQHELNFDFYNDVDRYFQRQENNQGILINHSKWQNRFRGIRFNSVWKNMKNDFQIGYVKYLNEKQHAYQDSVYNEENFVVFNNSFIKDYFVRNITYFAIGKKLNFEFGEEFKTTSICPVDFKYTNFADTVKVVDNKVLNSWAFFQEMNWSIGESLKLKAGLRINHYGFHWVNFQPRFNLRYFVAEKQSLSFSLGKVYQPLHLVSNSGIGFPNDIWIGAEDALKPVESIQGALGFNGQYNRYGIQWYLDMEMYWKRTQNATLYRDGFDSNILLQGYLNNPEQIDYAQLLTQGKMQSYGAELLLRASRGAWNGWISYALSKSRSCFPFLNNGEEFISGSDRTHNISLNVAYRFHKNDLSLSWNYLTGFPATVVSSFYRVPELFYQENGRLTFHPDNIIYNNGGRNEFRTKPIHSLSISMSRDIRFFSFPSKLEFGVYNLYNRKNTSYLINRLVMHSDHKNYTYNLTSVSLLPIIPYVSLKVKLDSIFQ